MTILKHGLKMNVNMIIAAIISFFLCISMLNICMAVFTIETGYNAHVYDSEENQVAEYYYAFEDMNGDGKYDGVDEAKLDYESKGYIVNTVKIRSPLEGLGKIIFLVITQVLSFIMVISFASSDVYKYGAKESNLIRRGQVKFDATKGFMIGLIGNASFVILFVLAIVFASRFNSVMYAYLNSHYYSAIVLLTNGAEKLADIKVWQWIVLFSLQLIAPAISGVAYIMGVKEINLIDKIVYKKEVE